MAYMNQEKKAEIAKELKKVMPNGWKYTLEVSQDEYEAVQEMRLRKEREELEGKASVLIAKLTYEYLNEMDTYPSFSEFVNKFDVYSRIPKEFQTEAGVKTLHTAVDKFFKLMRMESEHVEV